MARLVITGRVAAIVDPSTLWPANVPGAGCVRSASVPVWAWVIDAPSSLTALADTDTPSSSLSSWTTVYENTRLRSAELLAS